MCGLIGPQFGPQMSISIASVPLYGPSACITDCGTRIVQERALNLTSSTRSGRLWRACSTVDHADHGPTAGPSQLLGCVVDPSRWTGRRPAPLRPAPAARQRGGGRSGHPRRAAPSVRGPAAGPRHPRRRRTSQAVVRTPGAAGELRPATPRGRATRPNDSGGHPAYRNQHPDRGSTLR